MSVAMTNVQLQDSRILDMPPPLMLAQGVSECLDSTNRSGHRLLLVYATISLGKPFCSSTFDTPRDLDLPTRFPGTLLQEAKSSRQPNAALDGTNKHMNKLIAPMT